MNKKLILILTILSLVITSVYSQACVISNVQTFDNKFKDNYLTQVLETNQKKISSDNIAKLRTAILRTVFNDYYSQDSEKKGWTDIILEDGKIVIGLERLLNVIVNYDVVFVYDLWQSLAEEMVRIQKTTESLFPHQFLINNINELKKDLELDKSRELTDQLNRLEKLLDMFEDEELVWEETRVTGEQEIEAEISLESIIGTELSRVEINSKQKGYKKGNLEKISELDEGVYGEVFKVEIERKIYALKLLKAPQPETIASLKREFEVARRTNDLESTVKFYYYVTEIINGEKVIVGVLEDYVEGDNVRNVATNPNYKILAENYDLAWNDLLTTINRGILSTDVKANNIMVTKNGKIKIMDYGVAQFLEVRSLDEESLLEDSFAKMAISELENMYQQLSILQQRHDNLNNQQELIKAIQQVLLRSKDVLDFIESKRELLDDSWINTKRKAFLDNEEVIALSVLFNTIKDKLKINREQFDQLVEQVKTSSIGTLEVKISTEELNQLQNLLDEAINLRKNEFLKGKPASKFVRDKLAELRTLLKQLVNEKKLTGIESSEWAAKIDGIDETLIEEHIDSLINEQKFEQAKNAINGFANSQMLLEKNYALLEQKINIEEEKASKSTVEQELKPRIQAKPGTINTQNIKLEEGKTIIIGRTGDWLTNLENKHISAQHAKIQILNGKLIITDLSSTNGVFINGEKEPSNQQRILIEGDRIHLGNPQSKNNIELKITYKSSNFKCESGSASCTIPFKVQNQKQAIQDLESKKEILLQNLPPDISLTIQPKGSDEITLYFEGDKLPSLTAFNTFLNYLFDPFTGDEKLLKFAETYKVQEEISFENVITELKEPKFEGCNGGICYINNVDATKIANQLELKREELTELIISSDVTIQKEAEPFIIFGIGRSVTIRFNTAKKSAEIDQQIEKLIRPFLEQNIPELKKEEEFEQISETQRDLYNLIKESIDLDKLSKAQELLDNAALEESLPEQHIKQLVNSIEGKDNLDKLFIQIDYNEQNLKRELSTLPQISLWQRLKSLFFNEIKQEISELNNKKQELEKSLQEATKEKQTLQKLLEKIKYQVLRRDDVRNSIDSLRVAYEKGFISEQSHINVFNILTNLLTAKPSEFETLPTSKVMATMTIPKLVEDYLKEYNANPTTQNKAIIKQEFENYLQTLTSTSPYTEENNCSACEWSGVSEKLRVKKSLVEFHIPTMRNWLEEETEILGGDLREFSLVYDLASDTLSANIPLNEETLKELEEEFEKQFLVETVFANIYSRYNIQLRFLKSYIYSTQEFKKALNIILEVEDLPQTILDQTNMILEASFNPKTGEKLTEEDRNILAYQTIHDYFSKNSLILFTKQLEDAKKEISDENLESLNSNYLNLITIVQPFGEEIRGKRLTLKTDFSQVTKIFLDLFNNRGFDLEEVTKISETEVGVSTPILSAISLGVNGLFVYSISESKRELIVQRFKEIGIKEEKIQKIMQHIKPGVSLFNLFGESPIATRYHENFHKEFRKLNQEEKGEFASVFYNRFTGRLYQKIHREISNYGYGEEIIPEEFWADYFSYKITGTGRLTKYLTKLDINALDRVLESFSQTNIFQKILEKITESPAKRIEVKEFDFVKAGAVLEPVEGVIALDTGNKQVPGVMDHHHIIGGERAATGTVLDNPQLIVDWHNKKPITKLTSHENPDFDSIASTYLAKYFLQHGEFPEGAEVLAAYVDLVDFGRLPKAQNMENTPYGVMTGILFAYRGFFDSAQKKFIPNNDKRLEKGIEFIEFLLKRIQELKLTNLADESQASKIFENTELNDDIKKSRDYINQDQESFKQDFEKARKEKITLKTETGQAITTNFVFLENPQSALFKEYFRGLGYSSMNIYFSKQDPTKPDSPNIRRFVISTDPETKLQLKGLGEIIDKAEQETREKVVKELEKIKSLEEKLAKAKEALGGAIETSFNSLIKDKTLNEQEKIDLLAQLIKRTGEPRPGYTNADPWYDGRGHSYTIIDTPRTGTAISKEQMDQILREYSDKSKEEKFEGLDVSGLKPHLKVLFGEEVERLSDVEVKEVYDKVIEASQNFEQSRDYLLSKYDLELTKGMPAMIMGGLNAEQLRDQTFYYSEQEKQELLGQAHNLAERARSNGLLKTAEVERIKIQLSAVSIRLPHKARVLKFIERTSHYVNLVDSYVESTILSSPEIFRERLKNHRISLLKELNTLLATTYLEDNCSACEWRDVSERTGKSPYEIISLESDMNEWIKARQGREAWVKYNVEQDILTANMPREDDELRKWDEEDFENEFLTKKRELPSTFEEIKRSVSIKLNLDEELQKAGLNEAQIKLLKENSAGILTATDYFKEAGLPIDSDVGPILDRPLALGLAGSRYIYLVQAAKLLNYDKVWFSPTDKFIEEQIRLGRQIVFFVPRNVMSPSKDGSFTSDEFKYFLKNYEHMKNVKFVFGAYNMFDDELLQTIEKERDILTEEIIWSILRNQQKIEKVEEYTTQQLLDLVGEGITLEQLKEGKVKIGQKIGNAKKIGTGAYGVTYLLEKDGQQIVFKITDEKSAIKEINALKELKDVKGITRLVGEVIGTQQVNGEKTKILLYEYAKGISLLEYFESLKEQDTISEEIIQAIEKGLMQVLNELKNKNYFHNDVAARNLIIETDDKGELIIENGVAKLKIIDFGKSEKYEKGTPSYLLGEFYNQAGIHNLLTTLKTKSTPLTTTTGKEAVRELITKELETILTMREKLYDMAEELDEEKTSALEMEISISLAKFLAKLKGLAKENKIPEEEFEQLRENILKKIRETKVEALKIEYEEIVLEAIDIDCGPGSFACELTFTVENAEQLVGELQEREDRTKYFAEILANKPPPSLLQTYDKLPKPIITFAGKDNVLTIKISYDVDYEESLKLNVERELTNLFLEKELSDSIKVIEEKQIEQQFKENTPLETLIGKEGVQRIFSDEATNFEVIREDGAKITLNYLASGAFGSTFKLTTPEGVFALKIYDGMEGDPEQEWEGVKQADSLEEIAHGLTKVTVNGRVVGMLQEFVPGKTLEQLLNENVLFSDETIAEMRSIPAKLRKVGVVHRDLYQGTLLKPDNIKITPEDKVKVLDFGVSETWSEWGIKVPFSQFNEETFYDEYGIYHFITQMIPRRKTLHDSADFEQELENTIKYLKMYNNEMLDKAEIAKKVLYYAKENVEQAYKDSLTELKKLAEQKNVDFEQIKKIAEQKANKERPVTSKRNLAQLIMDFLGMRRKEQQLLEEKPTSFYDQISKLFIEIDKLNMKVIDKQRELNSKRWFQSNLEKELANLKQELNDKKQELEKVKSEARTKNSVMEINLALMHSNSRGGMLNLLARESIGGNAGRYGRYMAAGANFVFNSNTGEFVYFDNPQNIPSNVKGDSGGTLRVIFSENKVRIIEVYSLEGDALQKAQKAIDEYNKKFGFEIKDMSLDEIKDIYQLTSYIRDLFREKEEIMLDGRIFTEEQLLTQLKKAADKNDPLALTRSGGLRSKFEELIKPKAECGPGSFACELTLTVENAEQVASELQEREIKIKYFAEILANKPPPSLLQTHEDLPKPTITFVGKDNVLTIKIIYDVDYEESLKLNVEEYLTNLFLENELSIKLFEEGTGIRLSETAQELTDFVELATQEMHVQEARKTLLQRLLNYIKLKDFDKEKVKNEEETFEDKIIFEDDKLRHEDISFINARRKLSNSVNSLISRAGSIDAVLEDSTLSIELENALSKFLTESSPKRNMIIDNTETLESLVKLAGTYSELPDLGIKTLEAMLGDGLRNQLDQLKSGEALRVEAVMNSIDLKQLNDKSGSHEKADMVKNKLAYDPLNEFFKKSLKFQHTGAFQKTFGAIKSEKITEIPEQTTRVYEGLNYKILIYEEESNEELIKAVNDKLDSLADEYIMIDDQKITLGKVLRSVLKKQVIKIEGNPPKEVLDKLVEDFYRSLTVARHYRTNKKSSELASAPSDKEINEYIASLYNEYKTTDEERKQLILNELSELLDSFSLTEDRTLLSQEIVNAELTNLIIELKNLQEQSQFLSGKEKLIAQMKLTNTIIKLSQLERTIRRKAVGHQKFYKEIPGKPFVNSLNNDAERIIRMIEKYNLINIERVLGIAGFYGASDVHNMGEGNIRSNKKDIETMLLKQDLTEEELETAINTLRSSIGNSRDEQLRMYLQILGHPDTLSEELFMNKEKFSDESLERLAEFVRSNYWNSPTINKLLKIALERQTLFKDNRDEIAKILAKIFSELNPAVGPGGDEGIELQEIANSNEYAILRNYIVALLTNREIITGTGMVKLGMEDKQAKSLEEAKERSEQAALITKAFKEMREDYKEKYGYTYGERLGGENEVLFNELSKAVLKNYFEREVKFIIQDYEKSPSESSHRDKRLLKLIAQFQNEKAWAHALDKNYYKFEQLRDKLSKAMRDTGVPYMLGLNDAQLRRDTITEADEYTPAMTTAIN